MKTQINNEATANDFVRVPKVGNIVEGTVMGTGRSAVYVDLGASRPGVIYGREFVNAKNILKNIKVGTHIKAKIVEVENTDGYVELSLREAQESQSWDKLEAIMNEKSLITVKVTGANKGGLLASLHGVPAFLPVSQLSSKNYPKVDDRDAGKILKKLLEFVGQDLEVKIIDVSKKEGKLIVSEKATTQEISQILKKYKPGDIVKGEISEVTSFGAFIKFPVPEPDLEGLIHISELDWKLIKDPKEIVNTGDVVEAQIININNDGRIFLSVKSLKEKPKATTTSSKTKGDK
jgi:small subunit ribosomal protein S1